MSAPERSAADDGAGFSKGPAFGGAAAVSVISASSSSPAPPPPPGGGGGGPFAACCCMRAECCGCAYDPAAKGACCAWRLACPPCWRRATCAWRCGICCCTALAAVALAVVCLCIATAATVSVDCTALPGFAPGDPAANVPVVFTPGITGSLLVRGGALVYLTAFQALGLGAPPLALPAAWVGNIADAANTSLFYQAGDGATVPSGAAGLILDVRLTDCYAYEAYRTYVLWSQKCMRRPFYVFPYDWRRDMLEVGAAHLAFVRSVSAAHNFSKVQLVGHSLGGLLSLMTVNRAPGLVHSAVYVAAAATPSVGTLAGFNKPYTVGLSNDVSFPAASRVTLSSTYSFLALSPADQSWQGPRLGFVDDATGAPVALDLQNPQTWLDWGFTGLTGSSDPLFPALQAAIARGALVRDALACSNATAFYPPSSVVTSHYNASMPSGVFAVNVAAKTVDWRPVGPPRPGDGSVCADCASPCYPPSGGVFVSTSAAYSAHSLLMNDVKTLKAAMDAVGPYPSTPVPATG